MSTTIIQSTNWEIHQLAGHEVFVRREDLCCPPPGPSFSKIRGIDRVIKNHRTNVLPPTIYGVVDSVHSRAGWGVSYVCRAFGISCVVFYPKRKAEPPEYVRPFQQRARELGAVLIPIPATRSSILFYQARRIFRDLWPEGFLFPNGLKMTEMVWATADEVSMPTEGALTGTWLVSVSSGTIAAGVALGLHRHGFRGRLVLHMGFSRSEKGLRRYVNSFLFGQPGFVVDVVDEGYAYADAVVSPVGFPCNAFYDLKAWKWLAENIGTLPGPVLFWNIGA